MVGFSAFFAIILVCGISVVFIQTNLNISWDLFPKNVTSNLPFDWLPSTESLRSLRAKYDDKTILQITNGSLQQDFTTTVSIYFLLVNNTKHSKNSFAGWMPNMLLSVKGPLIMFVDEYSYKFVSSVRNTSEYRTTYFIYRDVWHFFDELEGNINKSLQNYYKKTLSDLPKWLPEMCAVWALKPHALRKASIFNPYNSNYFIYTDAGAFRERKYPDWPDHAFVRDVVAEQSNNQMLFGQHFFRLAHYDITKCTVDLEPRPLIEGTFFSGSFKAIEEFTIQYYETVEYMAINKIFIGKNNKHYFVMYCNASVFTTYRKQRNGDFVRNLFYRVKIPWIFKGIFVTWSKLTVDCLRHAVYAPRHYGKSF